MGDRQWEPAAPTRRGAAWIVLLAAAVVAGGLFARVAETGDGTLAVLPDEADPPAPAVTPEPPSAEGWHRLPHAPLVRRHGHSAVWTGQEILFWGGARSDERAHRTGLTYLRSGASYDPRTGAWRRLPASPLTGRSGHVAAWTGEEMVVWGGTSRERGAAGAAYEPVRRRWRVLAPGPLDGAHGAGGAWTGRSMLVWGTVDGRWAGASYDPRRDAWRRLPDPPVDVGAAGHEGVWAGDRLVLWAAGEGGSVVVAWDPSSSAWSVDEVAGAPAPEGLLAAGDRVLAWGGTGAGWAMSYDVAAADVVTFARPPLGSSGLVTGWDGRHVVAWSGERNHALLLDAETGALTALPGGPLEERAGVAGAWTGDGLVVWGGVTGDRHHADGALLRPAGTGP